MEAIIIAILEHVGLPLVMHIIAARTPRETAEAAMRAAYATERLAADTAAEKIIEAP